MKVAAWTIALAAFLLLAAAATAGQARPLVLPCCSAAVAAYLYLAVIDHRENR